MKLFALVGLSLAVIGCRSSAPPAPEVAQTGSGTKVEGLRLAGSFSSGGLTVIPILEDAQKGGGEEVTTLAEAQKMGTVEIRELPTSQVNSLLVINHGDKPLLLLAGDLLLGGKQDRIVAKDTLVPPGKAMQVEAFCVEHGRWTEGRTKFEYSGSVVPQSVKSAAARESQEEVWSKVAEYRANAAPMASMPSGTTVNGAVSAPEVRKQVDDALAALRQELASFPDAVGFVVARGGRVVAVELFGSPALFKQAQDAVLRGYLADSVVGGAPAAPVDGDFVEAGLKRALDARKGVRVDGMAVTQVEGGPDNAKLPLHGSYGFDAGH